MVGFLAKKAIQNQFAVYTFILIASMIALDILIGIVEAASHRCSMYMTL